MGRARHRVRGASRRVSSPPTPLPLLPPNEYPALPPVAAATEPARTAVPIPRRSHARRSLVRRRRHSVDTTDARHGYEPHRRGQVTVHPSVGIRDQLREHRELDSGVILDHLVRDVAVLPELAHCQ